MRQYFLLTIILISSTTSIAQPTKKPAQQKPAASQPDMNKMLEEAMKAEGMSKEEQAEMKKMMGDVMPDLMQKNSTMAYYPEFTDNHQLVPKREIVKINSVPKKNYRKLILAVMLLIYIINW